MPNISIGRIVQAIVDPAKNNGSNVAVAVITRVWQATRVAIDNDTEIPVHVVNIRILYDGHDTDWHTSVYLTDGYADARAIIDARRAAIAAFWPDPT